MNNSQNDSLTDKLGTACDNFSSTLRTIHLFDQFIDAGILDIPEEDVEDIRNSVKTPLTIMLSCFQSDIEEFQNELKAKCESFRNQDD
jgi:hypothetical protein